MKIKFLGAAGTVTGSGYLVTANSGEQILIDLGMFQGPPEIDDLNLKPVEVDFSRISGVVLTHAHLDHCGRLPILENLGFTGEVHMTSPTIDLTRLALLDSAKINREDRPEEILYRVKDVQAFIKRFKSEEYNKPFHVGNFTITLKDAGHIIGSAIVEVEMDNEKLVFSGDLGNVPEDLSQPTEFINFADTVVMESTYGDRLHPEGRPEEVIRLEINEIEKSGGVLLIPAFSLERTQELLHYISHMKINNLILPDTPIYLDSPMAHKATIIYTKYKKYLNSEIKKDFSQGDPFIFPGLVVVRDWKESQAITLKAGPKVIIAGSGMMTGGRIVEHARNLLVLGSTRLLIVGYQGVGTLGRELLDGEKQVKVGGQKIQVNATISDIQTMSSHADQSQLLDWLSAIQKVKKVILTHGENGPRKALAEKIQADLKITDISLPELNEELEV